MSTLLPLVRQLEEREARLQGELAMVAEQLHLVNQELTQLRADLAAAQEARTALLEQVRRLEAASGQSDQPS